MKLSDSVRKKKIETDGTRLRRGRQFDFFFLTESDSSIILVSFTHETTASFIFEQKNSKKNQAIFGQFHVKLTKKKGRFLAKTSFFS